jgi:hypothetical protein
MVVQVPGVSREALGWVGNTANRQRATRAKIKAIQATSGVRAAIAAAKRMAK